MGEVSNNRNISVWREALVFIGAISIRTTNRKPNRELSAIRDPCLPHISIKFPLFDAIHQQDDKKNGTCLLFVDAPKQ